MDTHITQVITLSNSIIGVGVLAMPFCFKQCGIILSIVLLLFSSLVTRLACHFLLKSSIMTRRRTFEILAFHTFGSLGKFVIEIGMIGFLMGTSIAFFVIMGDLCPAIIAKMTDTNPTDFLRTMVLLFFAVFCIFPLGLLKNVDSLSSVSTVTIGFYFCLLMKIVIEAIPHIVSSDWIGKVELWRPDGVLQCLPIFSMALSCQTQLFEIFDTVPNVSLEKMNDMIRKAVNICTGLYIFVGTFGYIAFHNQSLSGNILMRFLPSITADIMKLGFVLSVAFSFPLVIFPCRASLYSLLYKQHNSHHDIVNQTRYIPQTKFISITAAIIAGSLTVALLIPTVELVLGLVGSTIGVMICILFPSTIFVCVSTKNTNERILAQIMLGVGIIVMVLGTYANLYAIEKIETTPVPEKIIPLPVLKTNEHIEAVNVNKLPDAMPNFEAKPNSLEKLDIPPILSENKNVAIENKVIEDPALKEVRREPPQPIEPAEVPKDSKQAESQNVNSSGKKEEDKKSIVSSPVPALVPEIPEAVTIAKNVDSKKEENSINLDGAEKKKEEVDIEAIKKEDKELQENDDKILKQQEEEKKHGELIKKLEKHREAQKQLLDEQKQILEEVKQRQELIEKEKQKEELAKVQKEKINQIKDIAKQAIEDIEKLDGTIDKKKLSYETNQNEILPMNKNEANMETNKIEVQSMNKNITLGAPLSYQLGLEKQKKQPTLQEIVGVPAQKSAYLVNNGTNSVASQKLAAQMEPQAVNNGLLPQSSETKQKPAEIASNLQIDKNLVNSNAALNERPVEIKKEPEVNNNPAAARDIERGDNLRKKREADTVEKCDKQEQHLATSFPKQALLMEQVNLDALKANINFNSKK